MKLKLSLFAIICLALQILCSLAIVYLSSKLYMHNYNDIVHFGLITFFAGFILVLLAIIPLLVLFFICTILSIIVICKEDKQEQKKGIVVLATSCLDLVILIILYAF